MKNKPYIVFNLITSNLTPIMRDSKMMLGLVCDMFIAANPNYFYQQVIYFPFYKGMRSNPPYLCLSDIFIDQVDIKLVEEQSENKSINSAACFFFKN